MRRTIPRPVLNPIGLASVKTVSKVRGGSHGVNCCEL